jgi:dTDP-4-amino-4,6-dideoxygalactose transaminase
MSFIATPNAIIQAGAKPVFVDVEPDTANINAELIEQAITPRTRAIMPVHLYGHMCDMSRIHELAEQYSLIVIEDAAHALEASREGRRVAEVGDTACFSFYTTKSITSGEGGAIVTDNDETADLLKKIRLHGMSKGASDRYAKRYKHWDMNVFGWKYNMDNIHAALLLNQVKNIDIFWLRRNEICDLYERAFRELRNIRLLSYVPDSKHGRHMFTILVNPLRRDTILRTLQERGIGVAVNYRAIHLLRYYRETYGYKRGTFPVAEKIGDSTITLPLYPKLTNNEVEYIVETVADVVEKEDVD